MSAQLDSRVFLPSSLLPSQYYFASSLIGYIFRMNVYFCGLFHNTGSSLSLTVEWEGICRTHPKFKFTALLLHRPAWCECIFTRHLTLNIPSLARQRLSSWGPRRTPWVVFVSSQLFDAGRLLKLCFLGF